MKWPKLWPQGEHSCVEGGPLRIQEWTSMAPLWASMAPGLVSTAQEWASNVVADDPWSLRWDFMSQQSRNDYRKHCGFFSRRTVIVWSLLFAKNQTKWSSLSTLRKVLWYDLKLKYAFSNIWTPRLERMDLRKSYLCQICQPSYSRSWHGVLVTASTVTRISFHLLVKINLIKLNSCVNVEYKFKSCVQHYTTQSEE
jgi:hypothetical protein